jgi:hypothetical protein
MLSLTQKLVTKFFELKELREEKLEHMQEMCILRKRRSGLPVNLYLDDTGSWQTSKHWKRIKFQANKGDRPETRNMIPMSISDNPEVLIPNKKIELSKKELDQVKQFVIDNKEILIQLSDFQIDFVEFTEKMITRKL